MILPEAMFVKEVLINLARIPKSERRTKILRAVEIMYNEVKRLEAETPRDTHDRGYGV